jgi:flavodoxin
MKALIVYDSVFGNTEKVAQAIAAALEGQAEVAAKRVGGVTSADLAGVSALIVGSPTRKFTSTPAIKAWINGLPSGSLQGIKVAAFDTRVEIKDDTPGILKFFVKLFGYAAEPMAAKLVKKGGTQAMEPAGFIVEGTEGPMRAGEFERAADWAKRLIP